MAAFSQVIALTVAVADCCVFVHNFSCGDHVNEFLKKKKMYSAVQYWVGHIEIFLKNGILSFFVFFSLSPLFSMSSLCIPQLSPCESGIKFLTKLFLKLEREKKGSPSPQVNITCLKGNKLQIIKHDL